MKLINKRTVGGFPKSTPISIMDEVGQITEGIYKGVYSKPSERYKGKMDNLYFMEINGETCSFFGKEALDKRLAEVKEGEGVIIKYNGLIKNQKTGNSFHSFDVEAGEVASEEPTAKTAVKTTAPKKMVSTEEEDDMEEDPGF